MGTHAVAYRAWRIFFAVLPTRHRRWTTWQWERPARNAPAGAMPGVHSFLPWVVLFCPIMRGLALVTPCRRARHIHGWRSPGYGEAGLP